MKNNAFIFPGQGSQYIGMGKAIYDKYDVAKRIFNSANEELSYDIKRICFEGSLSELSKIDVMLVAIMTVSVATFHVLVEEYGINPQFLAGHSLGEYSALTCSGAIEFSDAIILVEKRSKLALEAFKNKNAYMVIVDNLDFDTIKMLCESKKTRISLACINSENQFAISGYENDLIEVEDIIINKGGKITPLLYSLPFHSNLMEEVSLELEEYLKKIKFNKFKYKVISNFDANVYKDESQIILNLANQLKSTVQWSNTVEFFKNNDIKNLIEVGPQKILSNLILKNHNNFNIFSSSVAEDRKKIKESLMLKGNIDICGVMKECLREVITTKNKCFDENIYQINVINKYLEIENWIKEIKDDVKDDNINYLKNALVNLKCIYDFKGISTCEQKSRINNLINHNVNKEIDTTFIDDIFINNFK